MHQPVAGEQKGVGDHGGEHSERRRPARQAHPGGAHPGPGGEPHQQKAPRAGVGKGHVHPHGQPGEVRLFRQPPVPSAHLVRIRRVQRLNDDIGEEEKSGPGRGKAEEPVERTRPAGLDRRPEGGGEGERTQQRRHDLAPEIHAAEGPGQKAEVEGEECGDRQLPGGQRGMDRTVQAPPPEMDLRQVLKVGGRVGGVGGGHHGGRSGVPCRWQAGRRLASLRGAWGRNFTETSPEAVARRRNGRDAETPC